MLSHFKLCVIAYNFAVLLCDAIDYLLLLILKVL